MPHPDMGESWVNGHPDEGLLHEWLDEQLSADNAAAVQLHVSECAACSALVAEARGLIAASHRILSALDDVPANVIPVQSPSSRFDDVVADLASRKTQRVRDEARPMRSNFRWQTFGKVAAFLLVALVPGVMFLRGDDVTVPFERANIGSVADSSAVAASPAAPTSQPISPVDSADGGSAPLAARARVAMQESADNAAGSAAARNATNDVASAAASNSAGSPMRFAPAPKKAASAEAERTPSSPAPVNRAEADKRVASVETFTDSMQRRALDRPAQAQQGQAQAREAVDATALRGRVAGAVVSVAAATPPVAAPPVAVGDQVAQLRSSAGGGRGGGTLNAPATPIPQITNTPPSTTVGAGTGARVDSASIVRELSETVRRSVGLASDSTERRSTLLLRGSGGSGNRSDPPSRASFDSVTLTRTNCATACETAVLHISNLGVARLVVSSGSTIKPVVTSRLSPTDRQRIGELLAAAITESVTLTGQHRCTISRATGSPELEVLIANGVVGRARAETRCTTSDALLRRLGASIDSIAGTEALRRRVP